MKFFTPAQASAYLQATATTDILIPSFVQADFEVTVTADSVFQDNVFSKKGAILGGLPKFKVTTNV